MSATVKPPAAPKLLSTASRIHLAPRAYSNLHDGATRVLLGDEARDLHHKKDYNTVYNILEAMRAAQPETLARTRIFAGNVSPNLVANAVTEHADQDSAASRALGTRADAQMLYASVPPSVYANLAASYHPYPNSVFLNQASPGVLIHELGHAIDLQRAGRFGNYGREMRRDYKPTLLAEFDAWRKGRQAYQLGMAADDKWDEQKEKEYVANMHSYNTRKYPAYGTYLGGAAGSLAGAAAATYGLHKFLENNPNFRASLLARLQIGGAGAAAGGALGILGGLGAGKLWAHARKPANTRKALQQLETARQHPEIEQIKQRLQQLRALAAKEKTKTQPKKKTQPAQAKAAFWYPPATTALLHALYAE